MESVYWVFTRRCNDRCAHCYNESGPRGSSLSLDDAARVVANLPRKIGRLILSGGEPLVAMDLLQGICGLVIDRYGPGQDLHVQTNGDLLNAAVLRELEAGGISRIDVAGIDEFHARKGRHRQRLERVFARAGWHLDTGEASLVRRRTYAFWGATGDLWLRGNWPRGRALANGVARLDPDHNFCGLWSGGKGFLGNGASGQEVAIQLHQVFPCCPGTWFALGDARREPVEQMLARFRSVEAFQALDGGDPGGLPVQGRARDHAEARIRDLSSCCLWCDEFFRLHYAGPHGARRPFQ